MRLNYTPNPPTVSNDEERVILDRVLARRGESGLIALDRTLLHAPLITDGWNSFMISIRTRNSLPPDIREVAFCRVAALTGAWYEWTIHSPIGREAGISDEALDIVKSGKAPEKGGVLSDKQLAVIRFVDSMTLSIRVPDAVFDGLRSYFTEKELVELTASIAGFNTVARFVTALDVGEMNSSEDHKGA
jgi:alkylhydroperoxidase family enzyme